MKILVCGCVHGRYDVVTQLISRHNPNLVLLLGDLQTFTSEAAFGSSLLKQKYQRLGHFTNYLTDPPQCYIIAIHGNHEDVAMLAAFPQGGFLTKNFFYTGFAADIKFVYDYREVQIFALSGINSREGPRRAFVADDILQNRLPHMYIRDFVTTSTEEAYYVAERSQMVRSQAVYMTHEWPKDINKYIYPKKLKSQHSNLNNTRIGGKLYRKLINTVQNANSIFLSAHMHFDVEERVFIREHGVHAHFFGLGKVQLNGYRLIDFYGRKSQLAEDGVWVYDREIGQYVSMEHLNRDYRYNYLIYAGKEAYLSNEGAYYSRSTPGVRLG